MTQNIRKIVATSGGSFFALMFVLGYTCQNMKDIVMRLNFNNLQDITTENIFSFFDTYGIDTGKKIEHLLKLFIRKKMNNPMITFLELYKLNNIEFTVTGTCLNKQRTEYFNYKLTPDMPIYLGVRISCSIPVIYNYVKYNDLIYVDGAILDNFPMDYFKNEMQHTLGFCVLSKTDSKELVNIKTIDQFMLTILISINKKNIDKLIQQYKKNTIIIECDYEGVNFNLSDQQKRQVMEKGYNSIKKYYVQKKKEITNIKIEIDTILNSILENVLENNLTL